MAVHWRSMYARTQSYIHTCTCIHTYTHTYTCIHAYAHTYLHNIHTNTHTYIHQGRGVSIWPDGGRYVGEWEDGTLSGLGVYEWPNSDVYQVCMRRSDVLLYVLCIEIRGCNCRYVCIYVCMHRQICMHVWTLLSRKTASACERGMIYVCMYEACLCIDVYVGE
jgi:hypothetical protein